MSYIERKAEVFGSEKKIVRAVIIGLVLLVIGLLVIKYFLESNTYFTYSICVLGAMWFIVRKDPIVIECANCGCDLNNVILSLGKKASKGYCAECGNEIT